MVLRAFGLFNQGKKLSVIVSIALLSNYVFFIYGLIILYTIIIIWCEPYADNKPLQTRIFKFNICHKCKAETTIKVSLVSQTLVVSGTEGSTGSGLSFPAINKLSSLRDRICVQGTPRKLIFLHREARPDSVIGPVSWMIYVVSKIMFGICWLHNTIHYFLIPRCSN